MDLVLRFNLKLSWLNSMVVEMDQGLGLWKDVVHGLSESPRVRDLGVNKTAFCC